MIDIKPHDASADPTYWNSPEQSELRSTTKLLADMESARIALEPLTQSLPAARSVVRALRRSAAFIEKPLAIAIFGEFNTGKSSLANMLIGHNAMPTAVVACTRRPTRTYFASEQVITTFDRQGHGSRIGDNRSSTSEAVRIDVGLPEESLINREIWDTPEATSAGSVAHFLRLFRKWPDVAIWCTSSTQAWKESERETWTQLPQVLRNNSILVVTFSDLLASDDERKSVMRRLRDVANGAFGSIVMICAQPDDPLVSADESQQSVSLEDWAGRAALDTALDKARAQTLKVRTAAVRGMLARRSGIKLAQLDRSV